MEARVARDVGHCVTGLEHAKHINSLGAVIGTVTRQRVRVEASGLCILARPTGIVEVCMVISQKHAEAELDCLSPGQNIQVKATHIG